MRQLRDSRNALQVHVVGERCLCLRPSEAESV